MNWVRNNGNHGNANSFFNPKDFLLTTIVPLPVKNFSCLWLLGCLRLLILWKIHMPMIIGVPTLIQEDIVHIPKKRKTSVHGNLMKSVP